MNPAMYKAVSGSVAQMRHLELVAQNLANVNTAGYKGERLAFAEILGKNTQEKDRKGGMVGVDEQKIDFSQGDIWQTGNPLDLAIDGEGFFAIDTERGERYTRQGVFTLSPDGEMVTPNGDPLMSGGGRAIRIAGQKLGSGRMEVNSEGEIRWNGKVVATIRVVKFSDPQVLSKEGKSLFRAPENAAEEATDFRIIQRSLERANVNPIEAMVTLITIQRQYESYQRSMRIMDAATSRMVTEGARG